MRIGIYDSCKKSCQELRVAETRRTREKAEREALSELSSESLRKCQEAQDSLARQEAKDSRCDSRGWLAGRERAREGESGVCGYGGDCGVANEMPRIPVNQLSPVTWQARPTV